LQVHLAVETWVLAHVHDKILEGLAAMASAREAKITFMLSELEKVGYLNLVSVPLEADLDCSVKRPVSDTSGSGASISFARTTSNREYSTNSVHFEKSTRMLRQLGTPCDNFKPHCPSQGIRVSFVHVEQYCKDELCQKESREQSS
jgi:hypothetical protein